MPSKDPPKRLRDIVENCDFVAELLAGLSYPEYRRDLRTRYAVERAVSIISEAAVKLGDAADTLCPGMPWRQIRGMGNHIRHDYDGIEAERLYLTARDELPELRAACAAALDHLKK